jgi:hypothetical protein
MGCTPELTQVGFGPSLTYLGGCEGWQFSAEDWPPCLSCTGWLGTNGEAAGGGPRTSHHQVLLSTLFSRSLSSGNHDPLGTDYTGTCPEVGRGEATSDHLSSCSPLWCNVPIRALFMGDTGLPAQTVKLTSGRGVTIHLRSDSTSLWTSDQGPAIPRGWWRKLRDTTG